MCLTVPVLALDILITAPIDQGCGCPVAGNGHFKWTRGQILLCMYHHHSYHTPAQDFLSSTSRMDNNSRWLRTQREIKTYFLGPLSTNVAQVWMRLQILTCQDWMLDVDPEKTLVLLQWCEARLTLGWLRSRWPLAARLLAAEVTGPMVAMLLL